MSFFSSSLFLVLVYLSVVSVSSVSAHNWLASEGRCDYACSFYPWVPRRSPDPHVQVGKNQTFTVEW